MTRIEVCADWEGLDGPQRLGWLHARRKGAAEKFEYEHDPNALKNPLLSQVQIDPSIYPFEGSQYPADGRDMFGVFGDSCPDRWGRLLMKRRLERDIREGLVPKGTILRESDYLLGVHDQYRVGALRYRLSEEGLFSTIKTTLPPLHSLRSPSSNAQAKPLSVIRTIPRLTADIGYACLSHQADPLEAPAPRRAWSMAQAICGLPSSLAPATRTTLAVGRWWSMR